MNKKRILVMGGISSSLINFRGPLLQLLKARGHDVVAAAADDETSREVALALGRVNIKFINVPIFRGGTNPFEDLRSLGAILRLLHDVRPDVLIAYTIKPVIYGGIAARAVGGISYFPMITGLGYAFTSGRGIKRAGLRKVVTSLYRMGLKSADTVIFQNPDDKTLFEDLGLINRKSRSLRVFGSGVDRDAFPPRPMPDAPIFLMMARLLADKGVREYVQAARIVLRQYPEARFILAGGLDPNPAAIAKAEVDDWVNEGVVEYLGHVKSAHPVLARCRYYVLPSYREGTPRSVLEAMSIGRPIITTDVPGCRETVVHGHNGLLVPPRSSAALAEAMIEMIRSSNDAMLAMGNASKEIVRARFDVHDVNQTIIKAMGL